MTRFIYFIGNTSKLKREGGKDTGFDGSALLSVADQL